MVALDAGRLGIAAHLDHSDGAATADLVHRKRQAHGACTNHQHIGVVACRHGSVSVDFDVGLFDDPGPLFGLVADVGFKGFGLGGRGLHAQEIRNNIAEIDSKVSNTASMYKDFCNSMKARLPSTNTEISKKIRML